MYCIHCGTPLEPDARECPICGGSVCPPKKSRPPLLIPVLIMTAMLVVGTILYFLIPLEFDNETPDINYISEGCFDLVDGTLYFYPEDYTGGRVLTVPETIGGETVTAIGDYCFWGCDWLTTIILPETVTCIGEFAFAECTSLRGMDIPTGVREIGYCAFWACTELEAVYIPNSVTTVGEEAFDECYSLRYIFYNGLFKVWNSMYSEYISPFTIVICSDGDYYQGTYSS